MQKTTRFNLFYVTMHAPHVRPDGRWRRIHVHWKEQGQSVCDGTDLEQVAALTPGFTGADLENLVNEAALAATRRNADNISLQDFNTGVERIVAGLERRNRLSIWPENFTLYF